MTEHDDQQDENPDIPAPFASLHAEVVTKADGRYLIYYSWTYAHEANDAGGGAGDGAEGSSPTTSDDRPAQAAWNPEGGPVDPASDPDV